MPVRIIDVREITQSISSPIRNAYIDFSKMTSSLVAVVTNVERDGRRVIGYGFNSNGRYGQGGLIRERFAPRLLEADPRTLLDDDRRESRSGSHLGLHDDQREAGRPRRSLGRGGHDRHGGVGCGGEDRAAGRCSACWPSGMGSTPIRACSSMPRAAITIRARMMRRCVREMRSYLDRGYTVVKMKIGGATIDEDRRRIEAVLQEIGSDARLAVDANGRFDLATAIDYAKMLRAYPLFWYEEPGDPLDYQLQAALAEFYPGPMATGENLFSHQDARNLIRYGGMRPDRDWLQFDCALSYGLCEYQRTLAMLKDAGWSWRRCIPHGGHQMSLAIAAGLGLGGNESYPDVFQPYGGFPDGTRVENGIVTLPELPGIGFEAKSDLYAVMRELAV